MEFFSLLKAYFKITHKNDKIKIVVFYFFHICSMISILMQPVCIARVFDTIQNQSPNLFMNVAFWLILYFLCFLGFNIFHRSGRFIEVGVAVRNKLRLSVSLYNTLYHLPVTWHSKFHSGAIISRIDKAANAIYSFGELQFQYITYIMKFWGPIIVLFTISYKISIVAFVFSVITVMLINQFDKILVPLFMDENNKFHKYSARLFDFISNLQTIITLRVGHQTEKELVHKYEEVNEIVIKTNKYNQLKWFFVEFCIIITEICTLLFYIWEQWNIGSIIQAGILMAIYQYVKHLSSTFAEIGATYSDIIRMETDFQSVSMIENSTNLNIMPEQMFDWKKISISDLTFKYEKDVILNGVNLKFENGKKIALIGESGSGKSTLLKILRGLYAIDLDCITIDGEKSNGKNLSAITTLIPQEPEVFDNTLLYNITLGTEIDRQKLCQVMRIARFEQVVNSLPNKLNSRIREKGVNLSGGEKQRLALARGLYAINNSSLILLDEPTSNIDPKNEFEIYSNIFNKLADCCIISAIHRLHLLNMFDYVYVFDNGRVIQQGTFKALKEEQGKLKELWNRYISHQ